MVEKRGKTARTGKVAQGSRIKGEKTLIYTKDDEV